MENRSDKNYGARFFQKKLDGAPPRASKVQAHKKFRSVTGRRKIFVLWY